MEVDHFRPPLIITAGANEMVLEQDVVFDGGIQMTVSRAIAHGYLDRTLVPKQTPIPCHEYATKVEGKFIDDLRRGQVKEDKPMVIELPSVVKLPVIVRLPVKVYEYTAPQSRKPNHNERRRNERDVRFGR